MDEHRITNRQPIVVERNCALGVITFKELAWQDHLVHITDVSRTGVGVESEVRIEPGFVWFKDRILGHRGGVLVWSRQEGSRFRAGIRFVPLKPDAEQQLQQQGGPLTSHRPHARPEEIIAKLIDSLTKNERA